MRPVRRHRQAPLPGGWAPPEAPSREELRRRRRNSRAVSYRDAASAGGKRNTAYDAVETALKVTRVLASFHASGRVGRPPRRRLSRRRQRQLGVPGVARFWLALRGSVREMMTEYGVANLSELIEHYGKGRGQWCIDHIKPQPCFDDHAAPEFTGVGNLRLLRAEVNSGRRWRPESGQRAFDFSS